VVEALELPISSIATMFSIFLEGRRRGPDVFNFLKLVSIEDMETDNGYGGAEDAGRSKVGEDVGRCRSRICKEKSGGGESREELGR